MTDTPSPEHVSRRRCSGCQSIQCADCYRIDVDRVNAALARRYSKPSTPIIRGGESQ